MGTRNLSAELAERADVIRAPEDVRLTTAEVAFATGVAPATLRKWASERPPGALLPALKRGRGRTSLYRPSDVRQYLGITEVPDKGRTIKPIPPAQRSGLPTATQSPK